MILFRFIIAGIATLTGLFQYAKHQGLMDRCTLFGTDCLNALPSTPSPSQSRANTDPVVNPSPTPYHMKIEKVTRKTKDADLSVEDETREAIREWQERLYAEAEIMKTMVVLPVVNEMEGLRIEYDDDEPEPEPVVPTAPVAVSLQVKIWTSVLHCCSAAILAICTIALHRLWRNEKKKDLSRLQLECELEEERRMHSESQATQERQILQLQRKLVAEQSVIQTRKNEVDDIKREKNGMRRQMTTDEAEIKRLSGFQKDLEAENRSLRREKERERRKWESSALFSTSANAGHQEFAQRQQEALRKGDQELLKKQTKTIRELEERLREVESESAKTAEEILRQKDEQIKKAKQAKEASDKIIVENNDKIVELKAEVQDVEKSLRASTVEKNNQIEKLKKISGVKKELTSTIDTKNIQIKELEKQLREALDSKSPKTAVPKSEPAGSDPPKSKSLETKLPKSEPAGLEPPRPNSVKSEPPKSKSPETKLPKSEPAGSEQHKSKSLETELFKLEPSRSEHTKSISPEVTPHNANSAKSEPLEIQPARLEHPKSTSPEKKPSKPEPAKSEPLKLQPARLEHTKSTSPEKKPSKPEPSRSEYTKSTSPKITPPKSKSAKSESLESQPARSEYIKSISPETTPLKLDSAKSESLKLQPARLEYTKSTFPEKNPSKLEAVRSEPNKLIYPETTLPTLISAKSEPLKLQPAKSEPLKPETSETKPHNSEPMNLQRPVIPPNQNSVPQLPTDIRTVIPEQKQTLKTCPPLTPPPKSQASMAEHQQSSSSNKAIPAVPSVTVEDEKKRESRKSASVEHHEKTKGVENTGARNNEAFPGAYHSTVEDEEMGNAGSDSNHTLPKPHHTTVEDEKMDCDKPAEGRDVEMGSVAPTAAAFYSSQPWETRHPRDGLWRSSSAFSEKGLVEEESREDLDERMLDGEAAQDADLLTEMFDIGMGINVQTTNQSPKEDCDMGEHTSSAMEPEEVFMADAAPMPVSQPAEQTSQDVRDMDMQFENGKTAAEENMPSDLAADAVRPAEIPRRTDNAPVPQPFPLAASTSQPQPTPAANTIPPNWAQSLPHAGNSVGSDMMQSIARGDFGSLLAPVNNVDPSKPRARPMTRRANASKAGQEPAPSAPGMSKSTPSAPPSAASEAVDYYSSELAAQLAKYPVRSVVSGWREGLEIVDDMHKHDRTPNPLAGKFGGRQQPVYAPRATKAKGKRGSAPKEEDDKEVVPIKRAVRAFKKQRLDTGSAAVMPPEQATTTAAPASTTSLPTEPNPPPTQPGQADTSPALSPSNADVQPKKVTETSPAPSPLAVSSAPNSEGAGDTTASPETEQGRAPTEAPAIEKRKRKHEKTEHGLKEAEHENKRNRQD